MQNKSRKRDFGRNGLAFRPGAEAEPRRKAE
jgi:hypothetical protein